MMRKAFLSLIQTTQNCPKERPTQTFTTDGEE